MSDAFEDPKSRAMRLWADFHDILMSGRGTTYSPDERGIRFDKMLRAREFEQSGLGSVASTLMDNIRQYVALSELTITVFNYGRRFQEVVVRLSPPDDIALPNDGTTLVDELGRVPHEWIEKKTKIESSVMNWMMGLEGHKTSIGGITNLTHVAGVVTTFDTENNHRQYAAFRNSMIVNAWTLFEALCEDLWEAALNAHPSTLADRFRFTHGEHERHRNKLGSFVINRENDVSFRSLSGIKEAYFGSFSKDNGGIREILEHPSLEYAAAVRNLLIHKQGIADKEFKDQVRNVSNLPEYEINKRFPIDGKLCLKLTDACRCHAVWLVMAVHAWIVGHPTTDRREE